MAGKQYGLIIPTKSTKKSAAKFKTRVLNPLLDSDNELEKDDVDDEKTTLNWIEASLKRSAGNAGQKCMQKRILTEAIREDSTVFQYDEIYDEMKATEQTQQMQKNQAIEKKPKYIGTILRQAEKRKLEKERRQERKVQKERDAEGKDFADKESFVTSSYLKKLEEMKNAEEEERLEKIMEDSVDIHKHKNFGVFYNHLLNQRLRDEPVTEVKEEPAESIVENKIVSYPSHGEKTKSPENNYQESKKFFQQNYEDLADKNVDSPMVKETGSEKNDRNELTEKTRLKSHKSKKHKEECLRDESSYNKHEIKKENLDEKETKLQSKNEMGDKSSLQNEKNVKAMDIEDRIARYQSLFAKRTVGNAFKDALKRYFERKADPI